MKLIRLLYGGRLEMKWVLNFLGKFPPLRKVVNYSKLAKESLYYCPACKINIKKNSKPFAQLDRYGFPVITNWCQNCDLLYINPRPIPSAFKIFYNSGDYRKLILAFSGKKDDHLLPQARVIEVISMCKKHLPNRSLSVLNVGGTRADYEILSKYISISRYICLNPGEEEAGKGYKVLPSTIESYDIKGDKFDLVCLLGTLNHLTEPRLAFEKIAKVMMPDSVFVFDYKDPLAKMARMTQSIGGLQFDHPTYPTLKTLGMILKSVGMNIETFYKKNQRVYTFIAARNRKIVIPNIFNVHESPLIKELSHRAERLPIKLILRVICSLVAPMRRK